MKMLNYLCSRSSNMQKCKARLFDNYFCRMQSDKLQLKKYKQFLQRADKNKVLKALPALHEKAFAKINCLDCAACCKNYSPRFKTPDIKRIIKHLHLNESDFIEKYLKLDEEGDYVARSTPCPFLGSDNY